MRRQHLGDERDDPVRHDDQAGSLDLLSVEVSRQLWVAFRRREQGRRALWRARHRMLREYETRLAVWFALEIVFGSVIAIAAALWVLR